MNNAVSLDKTLSVVHCAQNVISVHQEGRAHVLAHPTGITIIAQSLKTNNPKIKVLGLFMMSGLRVGRGGERAEIVKGFSKGLSSVCTSSCVCVCVCVCVCACVCVHVSNICACLLWTSSLGKNLWFEIDI